MTLAPWDEQDIPALLALDAAGPGRWRSRHGDANRNGRSYGGQLLGQAMNAALMDLSNLPNLQGVREPTMMQFLFLQGALPQQALDFEVTALQDGKRFSSRHVRATQGGGRMVLDAQVTAAATLDSPTHDTPSAAPAGERPESLPGLGDVDPALLREVSRLGGYSQDRKPSIDFRIPDAERQLSAAGMTQRLRFWMRTTRPLPQDSRVHAAVLAYLSDWWLNFSALGLHLRQLGERRLYIASLNHALWLHRPVQADQWLHVDSSSPASGAGRGLAVGAVHDQAGRRVATATQECLMAYV